jgi:hypothetical protein
MQVLFAQIGVGLRHSPHSSVVPQPSDSCPQPLAGQTAGLQQRSGSTLVSQTSSRAQQRRPQQIPLRH